jgi:hypothetical protein
VRERVRHQLGLTLIIISCVLWGAVLFVPMLALSLAHKGLVSTGLILISEVIFWLGILISGKELAHRYRQNLNPYHWWQKVGKKRK